MMAPVIAQFSAQLEAALQCDDLEALGSISLECDRFLRTHLPTASSRGEDMRILVTSLERLSSCYRTALERVESARSQIHNELHSLGRNRANTNAYLNVARNLRP